MPKIYLLTMIVLFGQNTFSQYNIIEPSLSLYATNRFENISGKSTLFLYFNQLPNKVVFKGGPSVIQGNMDRFAISFDFVVSYNNSEGLTRKASLVPFFKICIIWENENQKSIENLGFMNASVGLNFIKSKTWNYSLLLNTSNNSASLFYPEIQVSCRLIQRKKITPKKMLKCP